MKLIATAVLATLMAAAAHAQKSADPLPSFQKLAAACEAHLNQVPRDRMRQLKGGDWAHNMDEPPVVKYDVKRTDSLVSPFAAYIKVEQLSYSVRRKTEDEARAAGKDEATAHQISDELRYAFQDGKWKLVGGSTSAKMKMVGQRLFTDPLGHAVELTPEDLAARPKWSGCLP
jgi:hypothetical protein